VPTEFVAGRTDPRILALAGLRKGLLDDPKPREQLFALPSGEPIVNVPRTGTINNLVVIRFDQESSPRFVDDRDGLNSRRPE
jgi:hypothetical protein